MIRIPIALLAFALLAACMTPNNPLPISDPAPVRSGAIPLERLFASPSLSGPTARGVKFSPDSQRVTFLRSRPDEQTRFDLWQFDVQSGALSMLVDSRLFEPETVELAEAEKALRERRRLSGISGIVDYEWGPANTLLVPIGGDLYLVELMASGPSIRQLTKTESFEYDARLSPAGGYVSFIRDGALFAIRLSDGVELALSPPAEPDRAFSYGVAEFVAQEEMDRHTGYWWSPDDSHIAYTRVDESGVDIIPRVDIAADAVTVINQRYPRAGRPNAVVDLLVRRMRDGAVTQLATFGPDDYLARVSWLSGSGLLFQRVDRDQTEIRHYRSEAPAWKVSKGFAEKQPRWTNLSASPWISPSGSLYATTETTGFRHVVRLADDADDAKQITSGDWVVTGIAGADWDGNALFVTGNLESPLEQHLYRVSLSGGPPQRITPGGRTWSVTVSPDGKAFIGISSSPGQPPQTGLFRIDGTLIAWIEENRLDANHPYSPFLGAHTLPEFGTLTSEDSQTLYYSIQKPPGFDPSKRYPVIVDVYGGPGVQTVVRDWGPLTDVFYSQQGYIVFRLDNRGSANRGKRFEDVIYRKLGDAEVRDQLRGVDWLKAQSFVDPQRIAIQGWSYGGYMTLMTVLKAPPGTFAAAIAGAPVTDWSLYDTFYTERYMDMPDDNAEGYAASSVFTHIDKLSTPLLLVHGMADDNVTFDNTTRLMAELQQRGKPFEVMTYPGQRHGIRGEALQTHLMRTRMDFLERHVQRGGN